jgi:hypothetical protein
MKPAGSSPGGLRLSRAAIGSKANLVIAFSLRATGKAHFSILHLYLPHSRLQNELIDDPRKTSELNAASFAVDLSPQLVATLETTSADVEVASPHTSSIASRRSRSNACSTG